MKDEYVKIRLGKTRCAVARRAPNGWFNIIATTENEHFADLAHDALSAAPGWSAEGEPGRHEKVAAERRASVRGGSTR